MARVLRGGGPAPRGQGGRNDPCPCGSRKKYKLCHEPQGSAFLEKQARQKDEEHLREVRQQLEEQGVPWYRRLFLRL